LRPLPFGTTPIPSMPARNSLGSHPIERKTILPFPTIDPLLVSETLWVGSRSEPTPVVPAIVPDSQSARANTASLCQIRPFPNPHSSSPKRRHTGLSAPLEVFPEGRSHRPSRSHAPTNADFSHRS